jgi:hypothetical protein
LHNRSCLADQAVSKRGRLQSSQRIIYIHVGEVGDALLFERDLRISFQASGVHGAWSLYPSFFFAII